MNHIVESNKDFKIITELSDFEIQHIRKEIKNKILEETNFKTIEALDDMIGKVIFFLCDDLIAVNYISSFSMHIDSEFYNRLNQKSIFLNLLNHTRSGWYHEW